MIACTTNTNNESKQKCLAACMNSFLPKPVIPEKVARQLQRTRAAVESFDKRDRGGDALSCCLRHPPYHHKLNLHESMLAHMHEHLFGSAAFLGHLFIATCCVKGVSSVNGFSVRNVKYMKEMFMRSRLFTFFTHVFYCVNLL